MNKRTQVVTDATFEQETAEGTRFWLIFGQLGVGLCLMQAPILEQLSEEISEDELKIVKLMLMRTQKQAQKFGIMSIPTLALQKMVRLLQVAGVHTKEQIKAIVER